MAKLHFRPCIPGQTLLFPGRIDEDIAANDPVRIVNALVDSLNLSGIKALYKEYGRSPCHPRMMLKVILYAYMNSVYSCRRIEKLLLRDIHYIWLAGYEKPDFITVNRFRNRVKKEIGQVFTQPVLPLAGKGCVSLDVEYMDGAGIESKAGKYTFVWRKSVETNRAKLFSKIGVLTEQIDEAIARDKAAENESVEFTAEAIAGLAGELKAALSAEPSGRTGEEKKARRMKEKQVKEPEKQAEKLSQYDSHLETAGERNSYSKTGKDATFMRMKEDAMNSGQTGPGYNLRIAAGNRFVTDIAFFPNPTDTLTLIPFLHSFKERYKRLPGIAVTDSGYGSEENCRFMDENGMEAFVKYNCFHKEQRPPSPE